MRNYREAAKLQPAKPVLKAIEEKENFNAGTAHEPRAILWH